MRPILSSGLTLIEVLFSLLILSFALLGLEVMELTAWKLNLNAYYASLAEQQLCNLEERLRWSGGAAHLNQQVAVWNQENSHILPQGLGQVSGTYPSYSIILSWGGPNQGDCEIQQKEHAGCLKENVQV